MSNNRVEFFTAESGKSPAEKTLYDYAPQKRSKILRQLKYLEEFGLTPAIPNLRRVTNTSLWELRILGKDNIRVLCVSSGQNEITVLHIFSKKKQRTPRKDIDIALRRHQQLTVNI